jgi:hypothetical protein
MDGEQRPRRAAVFRSRVGWNDRLCRTASSLWKPCEAGWDSWTTTTATVRPPSAPLRLCGKTVPAAHHLPTGTSRRDAGTQGIPTSDNAPPCASAPLRENRPRRAPPPDGNLPQRRGDAGNTHPRQRPLCAPAGASPPCPLRASGEQTGSGKLSLTLDRWVLGLHSSPA